MLTSYNLAGVFIHSQETTARKPLGNFYYKLWSEYYKKALKKVLDKRVLSVVY